MQTWEDPVTEIAFSLDGTRLATADGDGAAPIWNVDYGHGNLFEVLCRRLPTRTPPAILETYGITYEPICTSEEPLPPFFPAE